MKNQTLPKESVLHKNLESAEFTNKKHCFALHANVD